MIHQAGKFNDEFELRRFLTWLEDLEYIKNGLPIPDKVIFLDMPVSMAKLINTNRNNKITGKRIKDIHEGSDKHMTDAYRAAHIVADFYNWDKINCIINSEVKSRTQIADEIYSVIEPILACVNSNK